jgi:hypothetical protein
MIQNDKLQTVDALAAVGPFSFMGAIKYDSAGRIVVSSTEPKVVYCNGLPFSASGALCVSVA